MSPDGSINLGQKCVIYILVVPFFDIPNMGLCRIELWMVLFDNLPYLLWSDWPGGEGKNFPDGVCKWHFFSIDYWLEVSITLTLRSAAALSRVPLQRFKA